MTVAYVILGDDYYEHEYFRDVTNATALSKYDKDHVFEIPTEKLVHWEDAEAAYRNVQDEIADLLRLRREDRNFARPSTSCLKSPGLPW